MSKLDQFLQFKKSVENEERQLHKDQGAYEQALKQLSSFGFRSIDDAIQGQKRAKKEAKTADRVFQKAMKQFSKKWKGKLCSQ